MHSIGLRTNATKFAPVAAPIEACPPNSIQKLPVRTRPINSPIGGVA
jgi:hypothetical protein